ncbi:Cadherin-23 [Holothuria leucospilota]|uniref:Cadherin-23 n=1 Tax=Holothuria leucospilota TaxID=206669 RepID=A0A9Q0YKL7_HOLLE|nr:Cadherin-23 [Holothuria leucospilota]
MARTLDFILTLTLSFLLSCPFLPATNGANPRFDPNNILEYASIPEEDNSYYVGQLVATDADGDTLTYGIQNTAPQYLGGGTGDAFNYLDVKANGQVFTKEPIDRETFSSLRAAWTVQDNSVVIVQTPPVYLDVTDINDNTPYFETTPSRLDALPETTANLSVVYTFDIVDPDEGINGRAQALFGTIPNTICETEVFQLVETGGSTFDLILVRTEEELDYAVQSEYTVCIYAKDDGNPSLDSPVSSVIIPIEDLQDRPPVFLNQPYDERIPENREVGEEVLTVTAQDGDRGVFPPHEIQYEMDSTNFEIDPSSGVITVSQALDRESTSSYILTVFATELNTSQPEEEKTSSTQVFITVEDVDDNEPTFDNETVTATIAENSPSGSPLNMELFVTDGDTPENAGFTLSLEQDGDAFRLQGSKYTSSARVDVRVNNNGYLDYEVRHNLTFKVIAKSSQYTSVANVTVEITDVNDNTPLFRSDSYEGSFPENVSEGYPILTVEADDGDGAEVTYTTSSQEFSINETSGEITTAGGDFDAELRTLYTFTVTASDGERAGAVLVTLVCTDLNDNAPQFQRSDYQIFEDEFNDKIPPEPIGSVQATDFDLSAPNNEIVYSIATGTGSNKFKINETTGDISFNDSVDYESDDVNFELTVVATDKGEPSKQATTHVTVEIADINDNPPTFDEDQYDFSIPENAVNGDYVGQVNATDEDSFFNGQVDYTILSGSRDSFYINGEGIIRTSGNLDRDEFANYMLVILARDRGTPQQTDNCTVVITLLDINDKPPTFEPDVYEEEVDEDASTGYSIVKLNARDSDEDSELSFNITSVVAYDEEESIVQGNFFYQFDLDDKTGDLTVNETLDRETVQTFILSIEVTDLNTDEGDDSDTATVTITVLDVNDFAPEFRQLPYNFEVLEHAASGTVISTAISAMDLDQGENGVVTYSLQDDEDGKFAIAREDGTLTVAGIIDREVQESYTLVVNATDSGTPPMSTTAEVFINVLDINDYSPVFNNTLCRNLEIAENSSAGTSVCSVYATDADSVFGTVTYSLQGGNIDGWFQIDNITGEITVASPPDRERADQVILNINAEDPGQRQATQDVTIKITDINDNAPEFTLFIKNVETTESTEAGVALATVQAEDSDGAGTNSEVRYNITKGDAGLFEIDYMEGVVRTKASLSSSAGVYILSIKACDLGEEPLCSEEEEMTIAVADVNDDRPDFYFPKPDGSTVIDIVEGYNDSTTPLFQAMANDSDVGENGEVYYRFFESPGADADWRSFKVDPVEGFVYFIGEPPDWYVKKAYELTLEAFNNNTENGLSSSVTFKVQVLDTIDTPPYFWDPGSEDAVPPRQELEVTENDDNLVVGTIAPATERDQDQEVYYFIVSGNEDGLFSLDAETGELSTTQEIDINDGITSYELIIKVTNDSDFQVESRTKRATISATYDPTSDPSLLTVVVTVIDTNNNPPIFTSDLYTAGVLYTVDFDVSIAQVEVTDLDIDEANTMVEFNIASQVRIDLERGSTTPDEAFTIEVDTGVIKTQTSFLSLTGGVYFDLNVTATDPTNTEYTDDTKVFITVITESQQLSVHVFDSSDNVRLSEDALSGLFKTILEEYDESNTSLSVDFDKISTYTADGTTPITDESEILFHVLELTNNTVWAADYVLYALDHSPNYIDQVKDDYSVDFIVLASNPPEVIDFTFIQWIVMVLAIVFLLLFLLVLLAFYFSKKQHERILKAYGIKNEYEIPEELGKMPGTNAYTTTQSNPVYDNPSFERDDTSEEEVSKAETDSQASEEAVMDMEDDEEDHYKSADPVKGNSNLLKKVLSDYDKKEEEYAHKIHMSGLEVSDV